MNWIGLSFFVQNSRHKTYGFDIMTEDEKVFYPLAADNETELEEWTTILTRAIASEMEDTDGEGRTKLKFMTDKGGKKLEYPQGLANAY